MIDERLHPIDTNKNSSSSFILLNEDEQVPHPAEERQRAGNPGQTPGNADF